MNHKIDHQKIPLLYFNFSNEERESAIYYLLESILKARDRVQGGLKPRGFDEDVNVYLAHLLFAITLPEYHDMADPFLSSSPEQVFEWARETEDPTLRYFIFKVNGDNLLVQSTLFNPVSEMAVGLSGKKGGIKGKEKERDEVAMTAILYYNHASRCHESLHDKKTGVGEVLQKLSLNFVSYQQVLLHVRLDYFNLIDCFREQAFQHFFFKMEGYEKKFQRDAQMELFLDAYQQWMQYRNREQKEKVLYFAQTLRKLDPEFHFDVSKLK